jgi:hypothetical protein
MIPEISHVHWLYNHAFTGACAGDYAHVTGCLMSHSKPGQAKTTSARSPVVRAIDC